MQHQKTSLLGEKNELFSFKLNYEAAAMDIIWTFSLKLSFGMKCSGALSNWLKTRASPHFLHTTHHLEDTISEWKLGCGPTCSVVPLTFVRTKDTSPHLSSFVWTWMYKNLPIPGNNVTTSPKRDGDVLFCRTISWCLAITAAVTVTLHSIKSGSKKQAAQYMYSSESAEHIEASFLGECHSTLSFCFMRRDSHRPNCKWHLNRISPGRQHKY